jgi:hypothetical protein
MTSHRVKTSGPEGNRVDETIVGRSAKDTEPPQRPTDEQVGKAAEELGADQSEVDTLPLDGE